MLPDDDRPVLKIFVFPKQGLVISCHRPQGSAQVDNVYGVQRVYLHQRANRCSGLQK